MIKILQNLLNNLETSQMTKMTPKPLILLKYSLKPPKWKIYLKNHQTDENTWNLQNENDFASKILKVAQKQLSNVI